MDQFFTTMAQTQSTQSPNSLHSINQSLKLQADQDGVESPQRRMNLPACAICGADSTGIHFGSEACAACSAFFRRTVVLNKQYICPKNGKCLVFKDAPGAQKCRACRFTKCIRVGMDRGAVQQRRDAIGKYSAEAEANRENGLKRDREPDEADDADASSTHDSTPFCATASSPRSPKSPKISSQSSVLDEFITQHEVLNRRRKLFYTSRSLSDVFDESAELEPVELSDFAECMFQLWQIEPRLAAEFISTNRHLSHLPAIEKSKLLKNFMLLFQAVEEPYLTWKFCGFGKDKWMMPNRTYIDFKNIDYYYMTDKCIKGLNLDKETARSLFIPSFQHALDVVGSQMAAMDIGYTELVALASILLLDPCISGLDSSTKDLCFRLRNQIIKDLFVVYQNGSVAEEPEVRLGMLINIISGIKVHAIKSMENMLMLKTFDICPRDKLFDEIVGIHG
ncbi:unnamed protein product, partial [Mesorhabditis belari]|uniref:Uncharacterized protein n=1 Tax=Mesorhabditis belari TaxID=2138241 RepID=A0AAF3J4X6_9BILA